MHIFLNLKQQQQTAITILHYVQQLKRKKEVSSTRKKRIKFRPIAFGDFMLPASNKLLPVFTQANNKCSQFTLYFMRFIKVAALNFQSLATCCYTAATWLRACQPKIWHLSPCRWRGTRVQHFHFCLYVYSCPEFFRVWLGLTFVREIEKSCEIVCEISLLDTQCELCGTRNLSHLQFNAHRHGFNIFFSNVF